MSGVKLSYTVLRASPVMRMDSLLHQIPPWT